MKEILTEWRKFLVKEDEPVDLPGEAGAKTVEPFKQELRQDPSGRFFDIPMGADILNKIKTLINMPDESSVNINFENYLNSLYPVEYFPGGWKKVVQDSLKTSSAQKTDVMLKHVFYNPNIKIKRKNLNTSPINTGTILGSYSPSGDELNVDINAMLKNNQVPIKTIVHELGHWINLGPDNYRINAENLISATAKQQPKKETSGNLEIFVSKDRAKELGINLDKGVKAVLSKGFTTQIYSASQISNFGKIYLQLLPKHEKAYKYVMNIQIEEYEMNYLIYILSRAESYERFYKPLKFWFASLIKKYSIKNKDLSNIENLKQILNRATESDYKELNEDLVNYGQIPITSSLLKELLQDSSIYPEMISVVRSDQPSQTQVT